MGEPTPTERQRRNVEIARRGFEAYNAGDLETVLALLHPEVELHSVMGNVGTFYGREGFLEWSGTWEEAWEEFVSEAQEIVPVGERHVIVKANQRARGRDGIEVTMRPAFAYELGDGELCSRMGLYFTFEEALAAVREWRGPE
jgi:ketosteroid isomerase-like protein